MQFCCSVDTILNDYVFASILIVKRDSLNLNFNSTQLNTRVGSVRNTKTALNGTEDKPVTTIEPWELNFVWLLTTFLILQRYPVKDSGNALI